MSESKIWVSCGFVEGETTYEAAEALGHKQTGKAEKVGGYSQVTTDKGVLQFLPVTTTPKCKWLAFRLVDPTAARAEYVPSGKRPRKPRSDAGKPRKEKDPGFTVVGTIDIQREEK